MEINPAEAIPENEQKTHGANFSRLKEILATFQKHGVLLCIAEQKHPERVRQAFEDLGPTFIKIGQTLSVRTDIVSMEFAKEFEKLQNHVPADDYQIVRSCIEEEAGLPLTELFEHFEEEPLASASIAQTHKAILKNGRQVAVKIQHPGIYEKMLLDISLMEKTVSLIKYIPATFAVDPAEVISELKSSLLDELDFTKEATNTETFYRKNQNSPIVSSPRVYKEYNTKKLLIMDYMQGDSISLFTEKLAAQIERLKQEDKETDAQEIHRTKKRIAENILKNYMKQVFDDGFFHADPHPGNMLIRTFEQEKPILRTQEAEVPLLPFVKIETTSMVSEQIVYLDFGMMGHIDERMMRKFNQLFGAYFQKNTRKIAQAILSMCKEKKKLDMDSFVLDVGELFDKYYTMEIGDISVPMFFEDVMSICGKYRLQLPKEATMLVRGAGILEGIVKELDPEISTMTAIMPYARRYLMNQLDPQTEMQDYMMHWIQAGRAMPQLPDKLLDVIDTTTKGKLTVNIVPHNLNDYSQHLEPLVNRLITGMIIAALIIGSSLLVKYSGGHMGIAVSTLGTIGYVLAVVMTIILISTTLIKKKK